MPKVKKNISNYDENKVPNKKKQHSPYKFDIQQILKERKANNEYKKKSAELDEQLKVVDELYQNSVKLIFNRDENQIPPVPPKRGYIIFDLSKYNTTFKNDSDSYVTLSNSQKMFIKMSTNQNCHSANVNFQYLMKADWSPVLDDIKNILRNWGADLDTLANKPLQKCEINDDKKIRQDNFELVMKFILHNVLKTNNGFTSNDLLTLAYISVLISFDHHCKQMINMIKSLFSACIEKALHGKDETEIISFSNDLYSKYTEVQLLKIINLFLPLDNNNQIKETIYKYITFKLFKSLLGIANNNNAFPSINDWFVQDLVKKDYFHQKPKIVLHRVIKLLDHVVVTLDLYKDEDKLFSMYHFLYAVISPAGLLESMNLINIIDKWKMHLFRLHIERYRLKLS